MKNFIKNLLALILLVCIQLNFIGCSKVRTSQSNDTNNNDPVTLKFVWWGNDTRNALTAKVIKLFEEKHPEIKIEGKPYSATQDMRTDLAMNTADENLPDIIQLNFNFIHDYANRNLLEPLDSYINDNVLDISNVDKGYLENGMDNNKIYGFTYTVNAYSMVIAPSVFEKAGVPVINSGYTYDDLYQTAKLLKDNIKENDFYPLANFIDFNSYIRSTGSTYYSSNGTELGYKDDQVFIDYFNLEKKFLNEGLVAPASITAGKSNKDALIVTGKSAFNFGVSNNISNFNAYTQSPLKIISVPSLTAGKVTSFIKPSMYLGVSSYSEHKEEAVKFIDFLVNDVDANNILLCERGIPVSSKITDNIVGKVSDSDKEQFSLIKYLKDHPSPIDPPTPNTDSSVTSLFNRVSSEVLNNKMTPEDGAKQFRTGANKILSGVKGGQ
jgi:multiple sugar transport system substrate-binding protein